MCKGAELGEEADSGGEGARVLVGLKLLRLPARVSLERDLFSVLIDVLPGRDLFSVLIDVFTPPGLALFFVLNSWWAGTPLPLLHLPSNAMVLFFSLDLSGKESSIICILTDLNLIWLDTSQGP